QDRLLTYGSKSYTYSPNGELQSAFDSATGEATSYSYDALGNLKQVNLPDGAAVQYVVDGDNHRLLKKVNGVIVKGWLYRNRLQPIAEVDAVGNVMKRFVYTERINVPDLAVMGASTYRLITDHLGSLRLVVDTTTGAVVDEIDFDEFGRVQGDTNAELL